MSNGISGSFSSAKVDVMVDMGNPVLNLAVDGFLKIGAVAATKVAAEETYDILIRHGSISTEKLEYSVENLISSLFLTHAISFSFIDMLKCTPFSFFMPSLIVLMSLQLKRMCREGASWGAVAGVYVGMEYGVERIRGTKDWKNALVSGAVTGALLSAASNRNRDKIVFDAIAGGAVATAAEFLNYLT
ncbi:outer envelope pore protein 16, chloroplastic isoform X1 [Primulina huaijiensis]|uniref:outer envelope pore protein 16, chloroplastic isoform X1 n=1 Tax=Primulina huaijiensis TaxID=1492673 RepID=UPI003CC6DFD5